ncbi:hypothetical protein Lal_00040175, partial [Lupinus albus]
GKGNSTFGGKVIVFGGDFRQILPVIPRGSRSNIINATINSSYIWDNCQEYASTKYYIQYQSLTIQQFAKRILDVGDRKLSESNDGYALIEIPEQFLITNYDNLIHAIVKSTYPNLVDEYMNDEFLQCRAILASTIGSGERDCLSSYSIYKSESNDIEALQGLTTEFLNSLRTSGLPNHEIKLKVGTPIMLLSNLDQIEGLCNGTRMTLNRLATHVIEAKVMTGKNVGKIFYISRMSLSPSHSL